MDFTFHVQFRSRAGTSVVLSLEGLALSQARAFLEQVKVALFCEEEWLQYRLSFVPAGWLVVERTVLPVAVSQLEKAWITPTVALSRPPGG